MEHKEGDNRLGTAKIGRLLLEFCIPAIVTTVVAATYNVIDTAFLGQALPDGTGVAVTTLALPVMMVLSGFSMIAGIGGNALAAIQLGEGSKDKVELTMGNTTLLLFILTAICMVASLVCIDPILTIIGTSQELWEPTKAFLQIICLFSVFQMVGYGILNFIRTAGKPMLSLIISVMSTVACIVFNYLFVMVLGWGVRGSAWATVCGQAFMFVPVIWYFTVNKKAPFHYHRCCFAPKPRLMGKILMLGLASFATQMASTVVMVVLNNVIAMHAANDPLGTTGALAAIGVGQKVSYFCFCPILGIMTGSQPIVGFNYGAKNWDRVLKTLKWSCIDGVICGAFFLVVSHAIPGPIVALFGVTGEVADFAVYSVKLYTLWLAVVGYQAVASGYFQSSGQPIIAVILELARQIIFLMPFYLFLPGLLVSLFGVTGLQGVVICVPVSDVCGTILTTIFVIREVRKLYRLRAQQVC